MLQTVISQPSGLTLRQVLNDSLHVYRRLVRITDQLSLLQRFWHLWHRKRLCRLGRPQVHDSVARLDHHAHHAAGGEAR